MPARPPATRAQTPMAASMAAPARTTASPAGPTGIGSPAARRARVRSRGRNSLAPPATTSSPASAGSAVSQGVSAAPGSQDPKAGQGAVDEGNEARAGGPAAEHAVETEGASGRAEEDLG